MLSISPLAKIHGKVTDIDGEPVSGVSVRALHSEIQDGRRIFRQDRSVTTDDQGEYRMWNFEPGDYYIVAAGRSGGTAVIVGPTPAYGLAREGFEPAYYPAARDRASATVIPLTPGQEFEANLEIRLQPAFQVRGTLRNLAPYQPVTLELRPGPNEVSANRVLVNAATGRFQADDVVPGAYLLRARQSTGDNQLWAELPVQVGRGNFHGIVLDLVRGVTVSGVLRGLPPPEPATQIPLPHGARRFRGRVTLHPVESTDTFSGRSAGADEQGAFSDEQGAFSIEGVPPGRYRLEVSAPQGYVSSATSGSVDLLESELSVSAGIAPDPLEIALRHDAGNIHFRLERPPDASDEMWILLAQGDGKFVGRAAAEEEVQFHFQRNAPGDYVAYLVKDIDNLEYRNPDVIRALRNGERIHVSAGGDATITLKGAAQ